jgi:hypothetical protein
VPSIIDHEWKASLTAESVCSLEKGLNKCDQVIRLVMMDLKHYWMGQIQAEDPHDGFGIYNVTTRYQVHVIREIVDDPDEFFDIMDRFQINCKTSHATILLIAQSFVKQSSVPQIQPEIRLAKECSLL